jgi:hypothetical protein
VACSNNYRRTKEVDRLTFVEGGVQMKKLAKNLKDSEAEVRLMWKSHQIL